jgi:L-cysteate sulfo-lyase
MTNHSVQFRSIAICAYEEGGWMSPAVIVQRVKDILNRLGAHVPPDHVIRAEIDVDQRFIGEDYAVPSAEGVAAIRELAQTEGVFVGPVFTAKGLAGMLNHIRAGRVQPGSNVAFIHTGDTGNLFEIPQVVGNVADNRMPQLSMINNRIPTSTLHSSAAGRLAVPSELVDLAELRGSAPAGLSSARGDDPGS